MGRITENVVRYFIEFCILLICFWVCTIDSVVWASCVPSCGACQCCVNGHCRTGCCNTNKTCCGGHCITPCDPDYCLSCDGEGHCEECGGDPNQNCCNGHCYDTRTQGCCDGQIYNLTSQKCCPDADNDYICDKLLEFCCEGECGTNGLEQCCGGELCSLNNCCIDDECISTCYFEVLVDEIVEICPECQNRSCGGPIQIIGEYQIWGAGTGIGYCKNPTKSEVVGFNYECEKNYDWGALMAYGATIVGYGAACTGQQYYLCLACISGMLGLGWDDCRFVEVCDPEEISNIYENVIDLSGDTGGYCIRF